MKYIIKDQDRRIFQNRFYDIKTERLLSPIETQNYQIIQVAESYYIHEFSIPDHHQICDLELTFSQMKGLICAADGVEERVDKHCAYLSFGGERHSLKSRKNARFQTLAVNIKNDEMRPLLEAIRQKERCLYLPDLFAALTAILTEFKRSNAPFFQQQLDSLITAVLIKISRSGLKEAFEPILSYDEKLAAIKNHMDTRFLQICSLEELSAVFGYTYSHISKAFKKNYGVSPREYLLSKKMEYACAMLQEGETIEAIADVLGYSTAFNFSRAFKDQIGLCPTAYRKGRK